MVAPWYTAYCQWKPKNRLKLYRHHGGGKNRLWDPVHAIWLIMRTGRYLFKKKIRKYWVVVLFFSSPYIFWFLWKATNGIKEKIISVYKTVKGFSPGNILARLFSSTDATGWHTSYRLLFKTCALKSLTWQAATVYPEQAKLWVPGVQTPGCAQLPSWTWRFYNGLVA
jgi:hypothetical protein